MEIEYINEDTIRVRIKNSDLEERGYTFLDLLGNQNQIEKFFYSILEEVDLENEFQDSEAVTFQVMPNPNGLELLISKDSTVHENLISNVDSGGFEEFDEMLLEMEEDSLKNEEEFEDDFDEDENQEMQNMLNEQKIVIEFNNFEQMIQLAKDFQLNNGFSSLYQLNDKYYIDFHLVRDEFSYRSFDEQIAMILEYGKKSKLTSDLLSEHAELMIENHALNKINHYFK